MSTPDSIQVEPLDERALTKRRKRFRLESASHLEPIPVEWRELLTRWVKRGGKSRWETLLKDAGTASLQLAEALREWLLRQGWAIVIEERKHGDWWPQSIELRNLPQLRAALGISDKEEDAQRWHALRETLSACCDDSLVPALLALDELPVQRALARHDLIEALQRWQDAQRSGTRRDFALFARADTKGLSEAEWNWLEQTLDLAEFRIERHTPLLLLSAPLTLTMPHGKFDLASCADFAALTPATLQSAASASGTISRWQLVENRTSFERVARQREHDAGVIWLPGFPPGWWRNAVGQLLDLAPAPAHIACDPDPAGIAIALKAAELWLQRDLAWLPWKMSATDLAALRVRKPLIEVDRLQLAALRQATALPAPLAELAEWMLEHGEKGEQEGYL
ncbi:MAG: hypothetical protein A3H31_00285 [Gallionellales bacterium RIFCSPLOWO2_02_FULL_57_47]|nr:MAG: hypothetical protein A3H31_00285 [Gallionellales bacterium RIFCSPLOWO2_02_FULL_57_47]OGT14194.1 MAG: hypothetical protein A3J49_06835 [Gallionellales bacterium RIFCSPHIGHO2_02_FULL_57_16]